MAKSDREKMVEKIVQKALLEWRSRPRTAKSMSYRVAHHIGHGLFQDMPEGKFRDRKFKMK